MFKQQKLILELLIKLSQITDFIILHKMGNDIVNFNPAYNTWAKYRAAVKYAK
jgi:hypothetical protein